MAKIRSDLAAQAFIAVSALITMIIAATARFAVEPRALAIIHPALCHASSHLPAFNLTDHLEPDPVTATARVNVHTSDLIIANATGLATDSRALHTEPFRFAPHLYLPTANSTARFESDSVPEVARANALTDSLIIASIIAAADAFAVDSSPAQLTESCAPHLYLPANSTARFESDSVPGVARANALTDSLIIASIIAAADAFAVDSSPAQLTESCAPHLYLPAANSTARFESDAVPEVARANVLTDSLIVASATTVGYIVASAPGDITRIFSSRHSTSITISRVLASTADADGAANADSATAASKRSFSDHSNHAPARAYSSMDVKNSSKYKKVDKNNPEFPAPGSRADSAATGTATAISKSDADADSVAISKSDADADLAAAAELPAPDSRADSAAADTATAVFKSHAGADTVAVSESDADPDFAAAAVSVTAADLASTAESATGRGLKRAFSDLAPDQPTPTVTWSAPLPDQQRGANATAPAQHLAVANANGILPTADRQPRR